MFVNGEQEQGRRLPINVGQVRAFESGIGGQGCGIGEVEAERETSLEPGFDSMAVSRDDLRGRSIRESSEMVVEEFRSESVGLRGLARAKE